MKRRIVVILLAACLGILTTIAVSWQAAYWPKKVSMNMYLDDDAYPSWITSAPAKTNASHMSTMGYVGIDRSIVAQFNHFQAKEARYAAAAPPRADWEYMLVHESFGWPMRSLYCERAYRNADGKGVSEPIKLGLLRSGILIPKTPKSTGLLASGSFHLPIRTKPIGFAINSLLYSAIFLFIPATIFAWHFRRHLIRTRRSLCLMCGYDLAGLDACPECNTPAPQKTAAT